MDKGFQIANDAIVGLAAVACFVPVIGPGMALMGLMGANAASSGFKQAAGNTLKLQNECADAKSACDSLGIITKINDQLDLLKGEVTEFTTQISDDMNMLIQDFIRGSQASRRTYGNLQRKIALAGWRIAIAFFFIVMSDIIGIWPVTKIFKK